MTEVYEPTTSAKSWQLSPVFTFHCVLVMITSKAEVLRKKCFSETPSAPCGISGDERCLLTSSRAFHRFAMAPSRGAGIVVRKATSRWRLSCHVSGVESRLISSIWLRG